MSIFVFPIRDWRCKDIDGWILTGFESTVPYSWQRDSLKVSQLINILNPYAGWVQAFLSHQQTNVTHGQIIS